MRHGMIGFVSALCLSVIIHAMVLGAIWMDQGVRAGRGNRPTAIFIPAPRMGEAAGLGEAVNSSAGDAPLAGRKSMQTQAALGREPTGASASGEKSKPVVSMAAPQPIGRVLPTEQDVSASSAAHAAAPLKWPRMTAATPPVSGGNASARAAGQPYEQSDSESDPFSTAEHVSMRNGRVDARFGRKVKTTRPNFGDEAEQALMDHVQLSVVLKVNTDAGGDVTSVDVLRSSGNVAVDLAVKLAMYNWWIEPPKGRDGRARADVMVWKITFE